jgi:hypothetical protein
MDERIEKAFEIANYMATLSKQRKLAAEEFSQKIIYYTDGATFKITPELIAFTSAMISAGYETDCVFIDLNTQPIVIPSVKDFLDKITLIYVEATNEFSKKFLAIKSKRKIADMVEL